MTTGGVLRYPAYMRKDAQLNLQRVLAAAKACFAEQGAAVTVEEVSQRAGVGVGTVYRSFGSRAGLVEALYQDAVEQVRNSAATLAEDADPWEGLAQWCAAYVEVLTTKRSILSELAPLIERDPGLFERQRLMATSTLEALLKRAQATGSVRADVQAVEVLTLLNAVMRGPAESTRMLEIVLAGVRMTGAGRG